MNLVKIEKYWTIIGTRSDGTHFDYRFSTKQEAIAYMKEYAK